MKNNNRMKWIIGVIVVQVLFLLALAGTYYVVEFYGKEIKLQTVPVDPRDLLYGDYVRLNYQINQIPSDQWKGTDKQLKRGMPIYVVLKQVNNSYASVYAYPKKPAIQSDEVVLRGKIDYVSPEMMRVKYGLERYYVSEGTGTQLQQKADQLTVTVKISSWGQAVISDIQ